MAMCRSLRKLAHLAQRFSGFGSRIALSDDGLTLAVGPSEVSNDAGDQVGSVLMYIFKPDSVGPEP